MNPCTRVGVDITWSCNWHCVHCFYRRSPKLHRAPDPSWLEIRQKIDQAREGGLKHVVMVGYGEPALSRHAPEVIRYAASHGMASSMITNGTLGVDRYRAFYDLGIDHLHVSSHGMDKTLEEIAGARGAFGRQAELKAWLRNQRLPYRSNVTLQRLNYRELPELVEYELSFGVYHYVILGFLPHYEWRRHVTEVAVHPAELRPVIETAGRQLEDHGTLFTIRYHPLCHLSARWWKYVVNARYVFFDPWEWNYSLQVHDPRQLWVDSTKCGESVACHDPCTGCEAYRHCGGWNRTYAQAFGGAGLQPIREVPEEYESVWDQEGGLHDLNPANAESGTIR